MPTGRTRWTQWGKDIAILKDDKEIYGMLLIFDIFLIYLKYVSISYWLKDDWLNRYRDSKEIGEDNTRLWRDKSIDSYCVLQLLILGVLLFCFPSSPAWLAFGVNSVAGFILFEIYLNLFCIFFLPRRVEAQPKAPRNDTKEFNLKENEVQSGVPSSSTKGVNAPSTSVERSVLLLLLNVLQITLAFGIFYRSWTPSFTPSESFSWAALAFGTIGFPPHTPRLLVGLQVFFDFPIVALILASLVGRAGPFAKS